MSDQDVAERDEAPPARRPGRVRRLVTWALAGFPEVFPRTLKYQVLTKAFMALAVLPLYGFATRLLAAHQGAVTNATLSSFLLSWRGFVAMTLTLVLFLLTFIIEVAGYVTLTARSQHGQPEASYRAILRFGFSKLRNLAGFGGILLILYLAVIVPIGGIGSGVSFLPSIQIPNFISSVIESSTLYSLLHFLLVAALFTIGALLIYTPHLVVLGNLRAGKAMRASARLVRRQPKLLLGIFARGVVVVLMLGAILLFWWTFVGVLMELIGADHPVSRSLLTGLLLLQAVGLGLMFLVEVPFEVNLVTRAYYQAVAGDEQLSHLAGQYPEIEAKSKLSLLDMAAKHWRRLAIAAVVLAVPLAAIVGSFFKDVYQPAHEVEIVAHRAGGFARPENSLSGLEYATKVGADWVEIDVQRTKDNHYILNHDDTFARAAGTPRKAQDLTLKEVKELNIGKDGKTERVPELREFLEAAKGKMKVIVELKGATADQRMGDDVVALIRELGMAEETMLMSLDYSLVSYLDEKYEDVEVGFAYFLSFGDVTQLAGDYLVLEEGEANASRLFTLGVTGRKTMVWTVNTPEGMERFVTEDVSGIITDDPESLKYQIARARNETTAERIFRLFVAPLR